MPQIIYKYQFKDRVCMDAVESQLTLAVLAAEGLYGSARAMLECGYAMDHNQRTIVIEGDGLGHTINKIFVSLVQRFIGPDTFRVKRILPHGRRRRRRPRRKKSKRGGRHE